MMNDLKSFIISLSQHEEKKNLCRLATQKEEEEEKKKN